MGPARRASPQSSRADDARPHRARRATPHPRADSQTIKALEAEIADLVAQIAPHLLCEPGFGPLTAAKLVGEIAGAQRFSSDAKLARAAGVAPIPVSSGKTNRHRLDRGGNRQINATIHRIAVTRLRCHPETQTYIARKRAEGKSTKEAIRCLKRHLTRRLWHLLQTAPPPQDTLTHQSLDIGAAKAAATEGAPNYRCCLDAIAKLRVARRRSALPLIAQRSS